MLWISSDACLSLPWWYPSSWCSGKIVHSIANFVCIFSVYACLSSSSSILSHTKTSSSTMPCLLIKRVSSQSGGLPPLEETKNMMKRRKSAIQQMKKTKLIAKQILISAQSFQEASWKCYLSLLPLLLSSMFTSRSCSIPTGRIQSCQKTKVAVVTLMAQSKMNSMIEWNVEQFEDHSKLQRDMFTCWSFVTHIKQQANCFWIHKVNKRFFK